ncbi:MAG: signal peptidase I [Fimbriimonadaceae bacterium]|nr:signal peptidase I [Fimbriimonadaceae bacterium]
MTGKRKKFILTGFTLFLLLMLGFSVFSYFNFATAVVNGDSMLPTLKPGRRLLFTRAYWLVGEVHRNDIVVLHDPTRDDVTIIKRVAGLAGDTIDPLNVPRNYSLRNGPYQVPPGMVYLLGDNRAVSEDSREFGPVDAKEILGKIVVATGTDNESGDTK